MFSCSSCFDFRCAEERLYSFRGFLSVCSSLLTHTPKSFAVKPAVSLCVTFVGQQRLDSCQQQQVGAKSRLSTACGWFPLFPRL